MNSKDKLELALHEAYIKACKLAEPSADFDTLVENAEIMSDGKKNIHFENYFLDEDIEENILNEVAKKYKLSKYMKGQLHIAYCLGCSPATKRKENDN